ncbi:MAG: glycine--tRNA ligase [Candidatus Tectomicrobia bacterium]|uniref:Glycine--tRNA ligase n=1 Tax=Tectimicrobiota bacterium TaxID=2528274 RepID=A0A932CMW0_UNCTE|nr:glycine--tRNA ligase [Candidatus Tectomicrobia bacterium]
MKDMEKIVSLCKRRGFIFQSSEIYGGVASTWDYGSLGVELKRNVKEAWWRDVVYQREDMEGLDAAILMNPQVWVASGHVQGFSDPLVDCKSCKKRFRADSLQADRCPECGGELTEARQFNLMFKTFMGPVEDEAAVVYLRPETAQGIFTNFINVQTTMRRRLPFGIAQVGKSFRNEITPGNFTFRTREFEQMEIEYFVEPGTDQYWHEYWVQERFQWYTRYGIHPDNLRLREHGPDELAHYARACYDVEYLFPMGWSELEGIANRTDFDLKQHALHSRKDLSFFDDLQNRRFIPYVIEPSAGADRATLAFLLDAYRVEAVRGETRVVLGLHPALAPIKVAILPLLRNRPDLVELARSIARGLRRHCVTRYDDTGSIGRLYRRQDEIGTPYCVTVDVQSLTDHAVTVRERDSMLQDRIPIEGLERYLQEKLCRKDGS